jgi:hypothetical protein
VVVNKRRKSGDIRLANLVSLRGKLIEGSLHVLLTKNSSHNAAIVADDGLTGLSVPMLQSASSKTNTARLTRSGKCVF